MDKNYRPLKQEEVRENDILELLEFQVPYLPSEMNPYFLSVGLDPGPEQTSEGHTGLILVAAPINWSPGLQENLHGRFGEIWTVRLDALVLRLPREWWDLYYMGAMKEGRVYLVGRATVPN